MKLNKKVTDFIKLEDGNIGRKAAVVTGALLASSVLATVLIPPDQVLAHWHECGHLDQWYSTCNGSCWMHTDNSCGLHDHVP